MMYESITCILPFFRVNIILLSFVVKLQFIYYCSVLFYIVIITMAHSQFLHMQRAIALIQHVCQSYLLSTTAPILVLTRSTLMIHLFFILCNLFIKCPVLVFLINLNQYTSSTIQCPKCHHN